MVGAWSKQRILTVLSTRIITAAMAGKSSPVAARVLSRIEGTCALSSR